MVSFAAACNQFQCYETQCTKSIYLMQLICDAQVTKWNAKKRFLYIFGAERSEQRKKENDENWEWR